MTHSLDLRGNMGQAEVTPKEGSTECFNMGSQFNPTGNCFGLVTRDSESLTGHTRPSRRMTDPSFRICLTVSSS